MLKRIMLFLLAACLPLAAPALAEGGERPQIILMDEPTEFLDAKTEELVMDHIEKLKEDVAIIAVVHRRKLLKIADRHYTLKGGQIVPQEGGD